MDLKPLTEAAIPGAIEKAKHYRLLNEPSSAESICRDILRVKPDHQEALVVLVLAMCDQFGNGYQLAPENVVDVIARLEDVYQRLYYTGISHERRGMASLRSGSPGSDYMAFECLTEAMEWYERAEHSAPPDNNDAILRWNTCSRLIARNRLRPREPEGQEPFLE